MISHRYQQHTCNYVEEIYEEKASYYCKLLIKIENKKMSSIKYYYYNVTGEIPQLQTPTMYNVQQCPT